MTHIPECPTWQLGVNNPSKDFTVSIRHPVSKVVRLCTDIYSRNLTMTFIWIGDCVSLESHSSCGWCSANSILHISFNQTACAECHITSSSSICIGSRQTLIDCIFLCFPLEAFLPTKQLMFVIFLLWGSGGQWAPAYGWQVTTVHDFWILTISNNSLYVVRQEGSVSSLHKKNCACTYWICRIIDSLVANNVTPQWRKDLLPLVKQVSTMEMLSSTIVLRRLVWFRIFVDLVVLVPSKLLKLTMWKWKFQYSNCCSNNLNMLTGPCYFILWFIYILLTARQWDLA